ncbi:MAG: histidinol-phosphatase [Alphaproteobacteria bacterium]|nr:histidinol-phosphatase [Alphaproteobacteria bacterium]
MSTTINTDFLTLAHTAADAAAAITLAAFRHAPPIQNKASGKEAEGKYDPVTQADKDAETAIRAQIEAHYPDHSILGEEHGTKTGKGEQGQYQWVIDPIDGTRAFISGIPSWGTLIALTHKGIAQIGMCDQPFTGERYYADTNGAYLRYQGNTQKLNTSNCTAIDEAIIATTTPELFVNTPAEDKWNAISRAVRLARYGGDCYNYALVASGQLDAVIEQKLSPYDILALVPLIESANGVITDWSGNPLTLTNPDAWTGQALACATPTLHAALLKHLQ